MMGFHLLQCHRQKEGLASIQAGPTIGQTLREAEQGGRTPHAWGVEEQGEGEGKIQRGG